MADLRPGAAGVADNLGECGYAGVDSGVVVVEGEIQEERVNIVRHLEGRERARAFTSGRVALRDLVFHLPVNMDKRKVPPAYLARSPHSRQDRRKWVPSTRARLTAVGMTIFRTKAVHGCSMSALWVDQGGAITLKLQGLPRMSVPACVSKARANRIVKSIQQSSSLYKSLNDNHVESRRDHGRELCTR